MSKCEVECLHNIRGDTHLRCCGCGSYFENERSGDRVNHEHIPAGPFMPSIKYANQYPIVLCDDLVLAGNKQESYTNGQV